MRLPLTALFLVVAAATPTLGEEQTLEILWEFQTGG